MGLLSRVSMGLDIMGGGVEGIMPAVNISFG